MGQRSFEAAAVLSTGVQTFEARFGFRRRGIDDHLDCPPIAHWRSNLTALSQEQNLYFVAYSAHIYVYVPQYPTQALPFAPALIVPSQPTRSGLPGTVDPRHPHSVNKLVVQRLGNEEIVAAVRDDGDVNAFLVRHIVSAVERRADAASGLGPLADEIKPMFRSNVGQSAWGLAIHTQARLLAVSANTHHITVFRFGLSRCATDDEATSDDERSLAPQEREEVVSQVVNGSSNIPHIAFCNTGDDPRGQWLLTCDIGGNCRSINLNRMQTEQTFRFGPVTSYLESHDRFNSGWGIFFLDTRSFIAENDVHAALGLKQDKRLPGAHSNYSMWDISETAKSVPRCAAKFPVSRRNARRDREMPVTSVANSESTSQSSRQPASSYPHLEEDAPSAEDDRDATGTDDFQLEQDLGDESDDSGEFAFMADLDFDDEDTEDSMSFNIYGGRRLYANEPRAAFQGHRICGGLPCPIIHTSVRNVYLLQPPSKFVMGSPFISPTVGFTNALHQLVPGEHAWLNAFERLNMHCYIPAIGVVVLASQKGRVIVLSLTKLSKGVQYPVEMRDGYLDAKTNYAVRIDYILPFHDQEKDLCRPCQPLHGIATSPIQQGTVQPPEDQRRWRLMLMYADHSMLNYEISRRRSCDLAVDLGSVVV